MKSSRLKNLRDTSGMTQQQVADKLGITRANYSHIENGRNEPDDDTTVKIAQLFDVSTDFLLGIVCFEYSTTLQLQKTLKTRKTIKKIKPQHPLRVLGL